MLFVMYTEGSARDLVLLFKLKHKDLPAFLPLEQYFWGLCHFQSDFEQGLTLKHQAGLLEASCQKFGTLNYLPILPQQHLCLLQLLLSVSVCGRKLIAKHHLMVKSAGGW